MKGRIVNCQLLIVNEKSKGRRKITDDSESVFIEAERGEGKKGRMVEENVARKG